MGHAERRSEAGTVVCECVLFLLWPARPAAALLLRLLLLLHLLLRMHGPQASRWACNRQPLGGRRCSLIARCHFSRL